MPFKINISTKEGKTFKIEAEAPGLLQKELGATVQGAEISPDLAGYELKITGASDKSGFTALESVEGIARKKVLLTKGKAMKNKPQGLSKKPVSTPKGLRLRKTVRGKVISPAISQINTQVIKEGAKKLSEIFPDQNAAPSPVVEEKAEEAKPEEKAAETPVKKETKTEEPPQNAKPENEPKETLPTEGNPEEEPKEAPKSVEEATHPDEEPKE